jgi:hypothetical protein
MPGRPASDFSSARMRGKSVLRLTRRSRRRPTKGSRRNPVRHITYLEFPRVGSDYVPAIFSDCRDGVKEPAEASCDRWQAVILGVDGISDFNALRSRKHNQEVQLYAFDMARWRRRRHASASAFHAQDKSGFWLDRIFVAPFEQSEIGPNGSAACSRSPTSRTPSNRRYPALRVWRSLVGGV